MKRRTIGKLKREVDSDEESLFGEQNLQISQLFSHCPCPNNFCDIQTLQSGEDNLDGSLLSRTKNSPYRCRPSSEPQLENPTMASKHPNVYYFIFRPTPGYTWPGKVKNIVKYNYCKQKQSRCFLFPSFMTFCRIT